MPFQSCSKAIRQSKEICRETQSSHTSYSIVSPALPQQNSDLIFEALVAMTGQEGIQSSNFTASMRKCTAVRVKLQNIIYGVLSSYISLHAHLSDKTEIEAMQVRPFSQMAVFWAAILQYFSYIIASVTSCMQHMLHTVHYVQYLRKSNARLQQSSSKLLQCHWAIDQVQSKFKLVLLRTTLLSQVDTP